MGENAAVNTNTFYSVAPKRTRRIPDIMKRNAQDLVAGPKHSLKQGSLLGGQSGQVKWHSEKFSRDPVGSDLTPLTSLTLIHEMEETCISSLEHTSLDF